MILLYNYSKIEYILRCPVSQTFHPLCFTSRSELASFSFAGYCLLNGLPRAFEQNCRKMDRLFSFLVRYGIKGKFISRLGNSALTFIWKNDIVFLVKFNVELPRHPMNFPIKYRNAFFMKSAVMKKKNLTKATKLLVYIPTFWKFALIDPFIVSATPDMLFTTS